MVGLEAESFLPKSHLIILLVFILHIAELPPHQRAFRQLARLARADEIDRRKAAKAFAGSPPVARRSQARRAQANGSAGLPARAFSCSSRRRMNSCMRKSTGSEEAFVRSSMIFSLKF